MNIKIVELYSIVEEKYKKYKIVIEYLEESLSNSQICQNTHVQILLKAEFDKISKLHNVFLDILTKQIQPLIERAKLQSLLTYSNTLKQFGEDYEKLVFLR